MAHDLLVTESAASVLCPELYAILERKFPGGVRVSKAGEPLVAFPATNPNGDLYTMVDDPGEVYAVCCPFCNDTRYRLSISHAYGQPGVNGRPMRFLAHCFNEQCLKNPDNFRVFDDAVRGLLARRGAAFTINEVSERQHLEVVARMPPNTTPAARLAQDYPQHPASRYLVQDRRYSGEKLVYYGVQYCHDGRPDFRMASERIIYPITHMGEFVGWQARFVGTPLDKKRTPKYYSFPGMRKKRLLYGLEPAIGAEAVFCVEGVTDVHVIGDRSVAVLGKVVSMPQVALFATYFYGKHVFLCLDPEVEGEAVRACRQLQSIGCVPHIVRLPGDKDPGDYDTEPLRNVLTLIAAEFSVQLATDFWGPVR